MWVTCTAVRKTKSQCTFYLIAGNGADAGIYFKAAAATPVILYNSLTTTVALVDTLPTAAKQVPWTKYSDYFWGAQKEDVK